MNLNAQLRCEVHFFSYKCTILPSHVWPWTRRGGAEGAAGAWESMLTDRASAQPGRQTGGAGAEPESLGMWGLGSKVKAQEG